MNLLKVGPQRVEEALGVFNTVMLHQLEEGVDKNWPEQLAELELPGVSRAGA